MAREMEREGFDIPLLIGGATTSKVHTAVKIDPEYRRGPVIHVHDASRAVGVASQLLSREQRDAFAGGVRAEYASIRESREGRTGQKRLASLAEARANRLKLDWSAYTPPTPNCPGLTVLEPELSELCATIDWTPFFTCLLYTSPSPRD